MASDEKNDLTDELEDLESAGVDTYDDNSDDGSGMRLDPDSILDSLVPSSIDWKGTVGRHPVVSVAAVGLVGYLVGRSKGSTIMTGLSAGLSTALMRQLSDVFEGDFFDF